MTLVSGISNNNNTSLSIPYPHASDYTLLAETAEMHASQSVARFIEQEVARPSKQWIANIIDGKQEVDEVVCRTPEYVLLPDTERVNRYCRVTRPQQGGVVRFHGKRVLNWLAIAHDKQIRTMRDLRGHHAPMLRDMLDTCLAAIENETGIRRDQVMAYVHYPPSVYQLHVHFSYPYGQYCHRDAYRVHNLAAIINNLEIDPDYYAKATLHMAIYRQSLHFNALTTHLPCWGRDLACKPCKRGLALKDETGDEATPIAQGVST